MSPHKRPFLNFSFNLLIPTIILSKCSSPTMLGPLYGLLVALAFPVGYGLYEFYAHRKINFFSVLGLFSVLLTGGIGVFHISPRWLAIKEAFIPGIIGVVVIASTYTKYPLLKVFFEEAMNLERLTKKLPHTDIAWFNQRFAFASLLLGGTFFVSAVLNFSLATWLVVSEPGTEAFNKELGLLNMLSFPVIALPMTVMMMIVMWYLLNAPLKKVGVTWEEFLTPEK